MPRLIDADVLMPNAKYKGKYDTVNAYDIVNCPTVDAVEVVRCKDCKWWKTKYMRLGERKVCVIEAYEPVRNEDEYCSWAERREDAKTD